MWHVVVMSDVEENTPLSVMTVHVCAEYLLKGEGIFVLESV